MVRTYLAAACLALLPGLALAETAAEKSFVDEFDTLDRERWYVADFGAFGDWINCATTPGNVWIEDSILHLQYIESPAHNRDYSCATVATFKKFGFGTYEARLKTDRASGLNMNFFTYTGPHYNDKHDEIDFEILTKDPAIVETNSYIDGQPHHGRKVPLDPPADEAFHVYSFEWSADKLRWYVNGVLVAESDDPTLVPSAPQLMFLSVWGTETLTDWMGPFNGIDGPKVMEVDWVAYTAPGVECQHPDSIVCRGE